MRDQIVIAGVSIDVVTCHVIVMVVTMFFLKVFHVKTFTGILASF